MQAFGSYLRWQNNHFLGGNSSKEVQVVSPKIWSKSFGMVASVIILLVCRAKQGNLNQEVKDWTEQMSGSCSQLITLFDRTLRVLFKKRFQ